MGDVYLRPLAVEDAKTSYKWRNDPLIWKFTGNRPDCVVTEEMERVWANKVIADSCRANFAICLKRGDKYIGNIYLIRIDGVRGELGIFIGDRCEHGKGYGHQALELLKAIAKADLGLREIVIAVRRENLPAIAMYVKSGARQISCVNDGWLSYIIDLL